MRKGKKNQLITFLNTHWVQYEDGTLTVGINEDGVNEILAINKLNLPAENDEVEADELFGDIDTDDGPFNLYAPVNGTVSEVNPAIIENPDLILEDPNGEGWLIKIEPHDEGEAEDFMNETTRDEE